MIHFSNFYDITSDFQKDQNEKISCINNFYLLSVQLKVTIINTIIN